jgi:hypothetical protein
MASQDTKKDTNSPANDADAGRGVTGRGTSKKGPSTLGGIIKNPFKTKKRKDGVGIKDSLDPPLVRQGTSTSLSPSSHGDPSPQHRHGSYAELASPNFETAEYTYSRPGVALAGVPSDTGSPAFSFYGSPATDNHASPLDIAVLETAQAKFMV